MPTIDGASLNGLLSSPLALIAGALAALIVVLLVVAFRRTGAARGLLLPIAAVVLFGLGLMAVLDRMTEGERAAERRALAQRNAELTAAGTGARLDARLSRRRGRRCCRECLREDGIRRAAKRGRRRRLYGGAADAAGRRA